MTGGNDLTTAADDVRERLLEASRLLLSEPTLRPGQDNGDGHKGKGRRPTATVRGNVGDEMSGMLTKYVLEFRRPFQGSKVQGSKVQGSTGQRSKGPRVKGPRVKGPRVHGSKVQGSKAQGSTGQRSKGPRAKGSRVKGPRVHGSSKGPRVHGFIMVPSTLLSHETSTILFYW